MCPFTANPSGARHRAVCCVVFSCAVSTAGYAAAPLNESLGLQQAAELAVQHQPLLEGLDAQARAAREASVSAAQLPDPRLVGGVRDLPVNTDEAYSFTRDSDTQIVVGVAQEFPRAQKRRLRGELRVKEAERLDAEQRLAACVVRRDASLAWLALWRDKVAEQISIDTRDVVQLQEQAVAIAVRGGSATQSDLVLARITVERLADAIVEREQTSDQARFALRRWIGDAANLPIALAEPELPDPPTDLALIERLAEHPELAVLQQRMDESRVGVDLAKANRLPDWRVEVGYGYRREFSDMVMLQVGMDLPLFTHNRQDRDLASASAMGDAAAAQWEDGRRQLESRALQASRDLQRLTDRLAAYNDTIVPQTTLGIDSAMDAWRSGRGTLAQVLDARRMRLDVQLTRLQLQYDAFARRVELNYLSGG